MSDIFHEQKPMTTDLPEETMGTDNAQTIDADTDKVFDPTPEGGISVDDMPPLDRVAILPKKHRDDRIGNKGGEGKGKTVAVAAGATILAGAAGALGFSIAKSGETADNTVPAVAEPHEGTIVEDLDAPVVIPTDPEAGEASNNPSVSEASQEADEDTARPVTPAPVATNAPEDHDDSDINDIEEQIGAQPHADNGGGYTTADTVVINGQVIPIENEAPEIAMQERLESEKNNEAFVPAPLTGETPEELLNKLQHDINGLFNTVNDETRTAFMQAMDWRINPDNPTGYVGYLQQFVNRIEEARWNNPRFEHKIEFEHKYERIMPHGWVVVVAKARSLETSPETGELKQVAPDSFVRIVFKPNIPATRADNNGNPEINNLQFVVTIYEQVDPNDPESWYKGIY